LHNNFKWNSFDARMEHKCPEATSPTISVIILNYNGARWVERCLGSLQRQTIFSQIEVVFADNLSPDNSFETATKILSTWKNGHPVQHGKNLGFCQGNNKAAEVAKGRYLFFLNCDTWLEPDCLDNLLRQVERAGVQAATPLMLNYNDDSVQSAGGAGFDVFGLMSLEPAQNPGRMKEVFVAGGCSYLILREVFHRLGGFDPEFFMYCDEMDLSWRVWASGGRIAMIPEARLHHRGAAEVNPDGGDQILELRTSDSKRYYTNRNGILLLLKNCQHVLLLLLIPQLFLLLVEGFLGLVLFRRWSFFERAYCQAATDAWKMRSHAIAERQRFKVIRRHSDWQMLRFLRWRPNRLNEVSAFLKMGLPKVDAR
jgi:hypothetical protein